MDQAAPSALFIFDWFEFGEIGMRGLMNRIGIFTLTAGCCAAVFGDRALADKLYRSAEWNSFLVSTPIEPDREYLFGEISYAIDWEIDFSNAQPKVTCRLTRKETSLARDLMKEGEWINMPLKPEELERITLRDIRLRLSIHPQEKLDYYFAYVYCTINEMVTLTPSDERPSYVGTETVPWDALVCIRETKIDDPVTDSSKETIEDTPAHSGRCDVEGATWATPRAVEAFIEHTISRFDGELPYAETFVESVAFDIE